MEKKPLMRFLLSIFLLLASFQIHAQTKYTIHVSANMEWKSVKKNYPNEKLQISPWGEYFFKDIAQQNILFFQEGWGKVAAAGATQYVIDQFKPTILINLGTCGGFEGEIERLEVVLADKTIIYDILEAMGDSKEAIADYTTNIDLSWLGKTYPVKVRKTTLVSADKDLRIEEIEKLKKEYQAVAGDWESGAIAYTAAKNKKKLIILRGVSDLVSSTQSEAHGNMNLFEERAQLVMTKLLNELPLWIEQMEKVIK
jgi:adenosylhomocysteine nucleosidase